MKIFLFLLLIVSVRSLSQNLPSSNGSCSNAFSSAYLDINNIKAPVYASGDLHWNIFSNGLPSYEFPKGSNKPASGAAGVWIGGITTGGQLKIAAQTYRQSGVDFWPGPVDYSIATNNNRCSQYDNVWKVSFTDINNFIINYNNGNVQNNLYTPAADLLNWPTIDTNIYLPQKLAPFVDVNHDGKYNPKKDGDYPDIKGDQALYHIYNDVGNIHFNTGAQAIGIQVNVMDYAYGCPQVTSGRSELLNTTFYHYKIYNRSNNNLVQTYIGIWVDATIGNWQDDYIGSNPQKGYAFAYNGRTSDSIYGNILPATGTVILKAPKAPANDGIDNDNDGVTDEANEELLIPGIYYYKHSNLPFSNNVMSDPANAVQYYYYMSGLWRDGSPFTCSDSAYGGSVITKHVFPGNNQVNNNCSLNWTENSAANKPGNRCYLLSMGPFNFNAKDSTEIEFAFVTSVDSSSVGDVSGSLTKLESDIDKVKNFYNMAVKPNCLLNVNVGINEHIKQSVLLYPNPVNDLLSLSSSYFVGNKAMFILSDVFGKKLLETPLENEHNKIDLTTFSGGIYFATVSVGQEKFSYKIIIQ